MVDDRNWSEFSGTFAIQRRVGMLLLCLKTRNAVRTPIALDRIDHAIVMTTRRHSPPRSTAGDLLITKLARPD